MLTYQVLWNSLDTIIEFWKTDWVMLLSTIYAAVVFYILYCNYFSKEEEEKQEKVKKDPVYILYYVISIVIFYKFFSLDWNQIAEVRSSSDLSAILITVLFAAFAYEAWKLNRKTLDEEIAKAKENIMKEMERSITKVNNTSAMMLRNIRVMQDQIKEYADNNKLWNKTYNDIVQGKKGDKS